MNANHIQRFRMGVGWCLAFLSLGILPLTGQVKTGTVSGGWRMPLMEENRLKTMLTGEGAKTLSNGSLEISKVRIELFDDESPPRPRMRIEAPECLFDPNEQEASSAGPIELRASDESFSIKGRGFRWNQTAGTLSISNAVRTLISRSTLGKPEASSASIEVHSDRFEYHKEANMGSYQGNVEAREGDRFQMNCLQLKVTLPDDNQEPERIHAEGDVRIELTTNDTATELHGEVAKYDPRDHSGTLHLTGQPRWKTAEYSGRGERISIVGLDATPTFTVVGKAIMELPVLVSGDPQNEGESRIRVAANSYTVAEAGAEFLGGVRAEAEGKWALQSQVLIAGIDRATQTITRITARSGVEIKQTVGGKLTEARGESAEFVPAGNELAEAVLTGSAVVESEGVTSWADRIELRRVHSETAVVAEGNVVLRLPRAALSSQGMFRFRAASGTTEKEEAANQAVEIRADRYRLDGGTGRFRGNVVLTDEGGRMTCRALDLESGTHVRELQTMTATGNVFVDHEEGELSCHRLLARFEGPSNQVETLVATEAVEIKQQTGVATGGRAVFDIPNQWIEMTVDPELRTRLVVGDVPKNVLATADVLIWDQSDNTVKGRGRFRIRTVPHGG